MLPARFLRPWDVLEMDIQDMHAALICREQVSLGRDGQSFHVSVRFSSALEGGRSEQEADGDYSDFRSAS